MQSYMCARILTWETSSGERVAEMRQLSRQMQDFLSSLADSRPHDGLRCFLEASVSLSARSERARTQDSIASPRVTDK
jgi:hypothetical protein